MNLCICAFRSVTFTTFKSSFAVEEESVTACQDWSDDWYMELESELSVE